MLNPKSIVVVQFDSFDDAKRWYAAEYAATIPFRNQSANSSLILVDGYEATKGSVRR